MEPRACTPATPKRGAGRSGLWDKASTARSDALRLFFYLPFAHAENLADQDRSVALNHGLGQPFLAHAREHREIIRRFGRFPHRNPILGRLSSAEELAFLAAGGFAG